MQRRSRPGPPGVPPSPLFQSFPPSGAVHGSTVATSSPSGYVPSSHCRAGHRLTNHLVLYEAQLSLALSTREMGRLSSQEQGFLARLRSW